MDRAGLAGEAAGEPAARTEAAHPALLEPLAVEQPAVGETLRAVRPVQVAERIGTAWPSACWRARRGEAKEPA